MKMNKKGYMLVELILASALAFGLAYFVLNLTIRLKNKNDDMLVETQVLTDKAIITNELMEYLIAEKGNFNCANGIKITNNSQITYNNKLIDIVNDYTTVKNATCTKANRLIKIIIPLEVTQLKDKNYDVIINYRY